MELTTATRRGVAIFDIDGTLTATADLDSECLAQAIADVLGVGGISTDWGSYAHSTDTGILAEVVGTRLSRPMTGRDLRLVRTRFVELLELAAATPPALREVLGARAMMQRLVGAGWLVAIATGSWRSSACIKLDAAELPVDRALVATADDAIARADIVRWARRRALDRASVGGARATIIPCVYIGDGCWDVEAARACGCGFVGIGTGVREERLRQAGAREVLEDFQNHSRFEAALESAAGNGGARHAQRGV